MTKSQTLTDDLCVKLRLVGIEEKLALQIVNLITRNVVAEGPENVVKRLKVLKQAAISEMAGVGGTLHLPWIRHTGTTPKGVWKPIWSLLRSKQYKHRKRAINAMMVYASLVLPKRASPTPTQERKFLGSVNHEPNVIAHAAEGVRSIIGSVAFKRVLRSLDRVRERVPYKDSPPDFIEWIATRRGSDTRRLESDGKQLSRFLGQDFGRAFQCFPEVQRALGAEVVEDYRELVHPWHNFDGDWRKAKPPKEPIGVIGSTQEPGMKFRAFASPHMVLQCALEPLKVYLLGVLKDWCLWDCTHNQDLGVQQVQEWLNGGDTVYSVDLSDATNNFPLDLQLAVLRTLPIPESTLHLLKMVSRSPYKVMWKDASVTWDVGQPLGAGPSFPSFALTHGLLAMVAEVRSGYSQDQLGSSFLVLGDDIVIRDTRVHTEYRTLLGMLACPISEQKCLQSALCAEFAGKLVTPTHIFHGFKYKDVSDISFMAVVRTLGSQAVSRKLLTEDQYAYAQLFRDIPEPVGLGFNPKGIPYAERWMKYLRYVELRQRKQPDSKMATSAELRNRTLYVWSEKTKQNDYLFYFPNKENWNKDREVDMTAVDNSRPFMAEVVSGNLQSATHIREEIAGRPLIRATMESGDPRPNPLQDSIKVNRALLSEISAWAESPSSTIDLSPVIATGETIPETDGETLGGVSPLGGSSDDGESLKPDFPTP